MSRFDRWRRCPVCGSELERGGPPEHEGAAVHCPACGFTAYDNPSATASALVMQDGRLLVTRRAREPYAGWLDLPGGFIEPGEHPQDAVRRELREETGLEIDVGELAGIFTDAYGDDGISTLNLFYEARVAGGDARPNDDVSEILWLAPDRIDPERLAFACCREALGLVVRKS
ncbi:MAG TPA: NUDIX domain-containing protein [Gaiellales bacterium]|nr:NUDIX domain-containing protein [Gaiellales bacterium]